MADPTIFSFSLLDRLNLRAETSLYVAYDGSTETIDALIGTWLATGGVLDDATSSQITGGHILVPLQPDGSWKGAPSGSGNKNNEVAVLNFANDDNQYATEVLLPAYLDAFVVNGKIDPTVTALAALIANILSTAGTADYQSRDIQQLTALRDAFLTTRKRRQQTVKTRSVG